MSITGRYAFRDGKWVKIDDRANGAPSVYFRKPYFEDHLASDDHPQGRWIGSKREKLRVMREHNLIESGDRIHGARSTRMR